MATASVWTIVTFHPGEVSVVQVNPPDGVALDQNRLTPPRSCGRGRVGARGAESHCAPGAHLLGALPGLGPALRHPRSLGGAANSLGFH